VSDINYLHSAKYYELAHQEIRSSTYYLRSTTYIEV